MDKGYGLWVGMSTFSGLVTELASRETNHVAMDG
jgi:hypothetical protein